MSLGGSSSSSQQLDPALRDAFLANRTRATGVAEGLQARQFAEFTPEQDRAMQIIGQFANPNNETFTGMRSAYTTAGQAANYNPDQVSGAQLNRGSIRDVNAQKTSAANVAQEGLGILAPQARAQIRDVNAGSFLNQNLQQYMNPYTEAVTNQSLKDLERSRQLQQQQISVQANAAKAFGGSRQGVAEAETNRAYDENAGRLVSQQNAAAYEAAQRASEADLARSMQAQQLNQGQDFNTTQLGLQLAGQFGIANQEAALRASLANQGMDFSTGQLNTQNRQAASLANQQAGLTQNQIRLGASGQMSGISQAGQRMGLTGAQALSDQGLMRQGFSQQQLDAIRNLPLEQQQIINQALGINVGGGSGVQQTSRSNQGLLGIFG